MCVGTEEGKGVCSRRGALGRERTVRKREEGRPPPCRRLCFTFTARGKKKQKRAKDASTLLAERVEGLIDREAASQR